MNQNSQQPNQDFVDYYPNPNPENRVRETADSVVRLKPMPKKNQSSKRTNIFAWITGILLVVGIVLLAGILSLLFYFSTNKNISKTFLPSVPKLSTNQTQNNVSNNQSIATFTAPANLKSATEVVQNALPSVLSINVKAKNSLTAGTGYVVSDDGLVITNKHVVSFACQPGSENLEVTAITNDQKLLKLKVMSIDPVDDIAILKIQNPPANLQKIEFGDSSKLQLGEDVVAIGNALGNLQNTVTRGIISGLDRSFENQNLRDECTNGEFRIDGLIQTDAAINKGNSGGPLFNAYGQVIGMNTLGTDAQSVGLAIPSATINTVLNGYIQNKSIIRARLGVVSQEINPLSKEQYPWLPVDYGEFVGSLDFDIPAQNVVSQGSSAELAGIGANDIILEINGEKLVSSSVNPTPLRRNILNKQSGETIEITYIKANKTSESISYDQTPIKKEVKLKGVTYNLTTKQNILVE